MDENEGASPQATGGGAVKYEVHEKLTPQFWLDLQLDYDLDLAENQLASKFDTKIQVYQPEIY